MAKDYSRTAATAVRLVTKYGRDVSLYGDATDYIDDNKKTRGKSDPTPVTAKAVFVYPTGYRQLGLSVESAALLKNSAAIALVAPVAGFDAGTVSKVSDGGRDYLVEAVEVLQPGDVPLLYYIGLKR
jgi:hypothetical protein